jgi:hypothetical protein
VSSTDLRPSIRATYDSRETGPRYHVTVTVDDRPWVFRDPIPDPFARTTVRLTRWDLLRSLLHGMRVEVTIGGDPDVMNDVMELDENTLIAGRTRAAAFRQSIHQKLHAMVDEL